jgi:hypothetical protein
MSYRALIYITIYFTFPNPIITTIVPDINNHAGESAKSEETCPIYFKSFEVAIYGGIL